MLPAHEVRTLKHHIKKMLTQLKETNVDRITHVTPEMTIVLIDKTLSSFAQLDELLTRMPPDQLTPQDYRNWENARTVAEQTRALKHLLVGEPERERERELRQMIGDADTDLTLG